MIWTGRAEICFAEMTPQFLIRARGCSLALVAYPGLRSVGTEGPCQTLCWTTGTLGALADSTPSALGRVLWQCLTSRGPRPRDTSLLSLSGTGLYAGS